MPIDPTKPTTPKDGETPPGDKTEANTPPKDGDKTADPEKVDAAYVAKLKAENAERRVENKKMKDALERQNKALAILQGKDEGTVDPVEKAKADTDRRLRNAMLKGELAALARDAHDPAMLLTVAPSLFKDVTVDVETEFVDPGELTAALDQMRKDKPFLFRTADSNTIAGQAKKGATLPKDGGQPTKGENPYAVWNQLKDQGRAGEAQEFYTKNRAAIMAQMKSNNISL